MPSVKLVFSTHRGLFFFTIDTAANEGGLQELSFGYYYGIAVYDDYILAARRIDPWSSKVSPTAFEKWSKDGVCLGMSELGGNDIIDVHEMALGPNGLYICNLGNQTVEIRDPLTFELKRNLIFKAGEVPGGMMVNSVFVDGDDFYLLFHNRGQTSFIQHMTHAGEDLVFNRRIFIASNGAHNIAVRNQNLFYNASDSGAVHRLELNDLETEDWDLKGKVPYRCNTFDENLHTKGMALYDDFVIVGASEKGMLNHRFKSESSIEFLETDTFRRAFGFSLIHPNGGFVGNINEIRVLD